MVCEGSRCQKHNRQRPRRRLDSFRRQGKQWKKKRRLAKTEMSERKSIWILKSIPSASLCRHWALHWPGQHFVSSECPKNLGTSGARLGAIQEKTSEPLKQQTEKGSSSLAVLFDQCFFQQHHWFGSVCWKHTEQTQHSTSHSTWF